MSLLDKIAKENKIQAQLNSQLSEMTYRAFNGTRQAPRNFREGILNVGTINFKTADDKITKEMIMDYQQKEQEKFFTDAVGNKKLFDQTGLTDVLVTPTLINYPTTGAPATAADVNTEKTKLNTLYKDLDTLLKEENAKNEELNDNQYDLSILKSTLIQSKKDENAFNTKLTKVQTLLSNPAFLLGSPGADKKLLKLEKEINDQIKDVQKDITTVNDKILDIQTKDIPAIEADILTIVTNIGVKKTNITAQDIVLKQIEKNVADNKVEEQKATITNKGIAQKYQETFNYLNRNRASVQQDPNESEADFIRRVKSQEMLAFDPSIYKQKAANEGSSKLMDSLKEVTRDEVKISDIVKSFPKPEDVFIINSNWPIISNQLKIKFGVNNPNITVGEYSAEITDIMDTLINKPFGTTIVPPSVSTATITRTYTAAAPIGPTNPLMDTTTTPPSPTDFDYAIEDNSLFIRNKVLGKQIYIKIAQKNGKKILFSDTTNEENKFRAFNKLIKPLLFNTVMKELGTTKNILNMIFGIGTTLPDKYDFLKSEYGLTDVTGKSFFDEGRPMVGWGIKQEEIPQYTMFGKNIILYNKLYYKNMLAIKDKKGHSVEHFKNVKVSDKLAEIIINMIQNIQPTKQNLESLKTSERQLFDLLIYVSGLNKKVNTKKDDNIDELKERLKLVEAQIRSGNDNPVVKKELVDIVNKLQLYNCISMNNARDYLKQF